MTQKTLSLSTKELPEGFWNEPLKWLSQFREMFYQFHSTSNGNAGWNRHIDGSTFLFGSMKFQ